MAFRASETFSVNTIFDISNNSWYYDIPAPTVAQPGDLLVLGLLTDSSVNGETGVLSSAPLSTIPSDGWVSLTQDQFGGAAGAQMNFFTKLYYGETGTIKFYAQPNVNYGRAIGIHSAWNNSQIITQYGGAVGNTGASPKTAVVGVSTTAQSPALPASQSSLALFHYVSANTTGTWTFGISGSGTTATQQTSVNETTAQLALSLGTMNSTSSGVFTGSATSTATQASGNIVVASIKAIEITERLPPAISTIGSSAEGIADISDLSGSSYWTFTGALNQSDYTLAPKGTSPYIYSPISPLNNTSLMISGYSFVSPVMSWPGALVLNQETLLDGSRDYLDRGAQAWQLLGYGLAKQTISGRYVYSALYVKILAGEAGFYQFKSNVVVDGSTYGSGVAARFFTPGQVSKVISSAQYGSSLLTDGGSFVMPQASTMTLPITGRNGIAVAMLAYTNDRTTGSLSITPPAGYTLIQASQSSISNIAYYFAYKYITAPGDYGGSFSVTDSVADRAWSSCCGAILFDNIGGSRFKPR